MTHQGKAYIGLPIVDQHGKVIGWARKDAESVLKIDAHVDDNGTAWEPPTAWAYMQVCKARDEWQAKAEAYEASWPDKPACKHHHVPTNETVGGCVIYRCACGDEYEKDVT